jgi:hypothetical protein
MALPIPLLPLIIIFFLIMHKILALALGIKAEMLMILLIKLKRLR